MTQSGALSQPPAPLSRVSLREAVRRALERNPDIEQARAEINRAEGLMRVARASAMPTLVGNATYTRLDSDRTLVSGGATRVIASQNQLGANLLLNIPILSFTSWTQWSQAKEGIEVARISVTEVRRRVAIAVGQTYLGIVAAKRLVQVEDRAATTARVHMEFVKKRIEAGTGHRLDLVRAQQELATAEGLRANSYSAMIRAQEALGVLAGDNGPLDVEDAPREIPLSSTVPDERTVLSRRDDVRAAEARLALQDRTVREGWTEFTPNLNAIFMPFYQNPPTLTVPQTGWQAQLVLSVPFYDGGARYGRQDQRRALAKEAGLTLDRTKRQALSEVRVARATVEQSRMAREAAERAAALARETLDLARQSYEAGVISELEVIDAERTARDVEAQAAAAEEASLQAELDLLAALGQFP
jgi:outer membrane protein TolC